jgi:hypothetical protein
MAVDKPRDRPTVPDVLPLVRSIYTRHCAGCCLHILTDDCNVDDDSAAFCLETARERGHAECITAAEMLVQMTTTQRRKVYRNH